MIPRFGSRFRSRFCHVLVPLFVGAIGFFTAGCTPAPEPSANSGINTTPSAPVSLRLIVVDDEPLAARIEREWTARSGGGLETKQLSTAEFVGSLKDRRIAADVIVYPSAMLGELAARESIAPFRDEAMDDPHWNQRDVLGLIRRQESMWGQRTVALSLGSPILVLYYRKDLFQQLGLAPPTSWSDYQMAASQLASFAAKKKNAGETVEWVANCEPLSDGWAGQILLARAAAYARHRSSYSTLFNYVTLDPLIDKAPFVRALQELIEATRPVKDLALTLSPSDVRRMVHEGKCAMAMTWPSAATKVGDDPSRTQTLGIVNLPGSKDVYQFREQKWETRSGVEYVPLLGVSGRLVSVAKSSRHLEAATAMAVWLSGPDLGAEVSTVSGSTTIFRKSQFANINSWVESNLDRTAIDDYHKSIQAAHESSAWLTSLNLPGHFEYRAALDRAVQRGVRGELTAEAALKEVATEWRVISERLGVDKQRRAYEQSLGISP